MKIAAHERHRRQQPDRGPLSGGGGLPPGGRRVRRRAAAVPPPLLLTDWHRVEIANAFQRAVKNGRITPAQASQLWQDFSDDIAAGRFQVASIDHVAVLARTLQLTQRHTATTGTRTLDLIHVATAIELAAVEFLSFDHRQRQAAAAEGLALLP